MQKIQKGTKMKEIDEQIIYEFDRLYYRVMGLYVRFENTHNINKPLCKVLHALLISEIHTQKDIMQSYEMPKQTINNVILSLQKQGLVTIDCSPSDKREKIINLTPQGQIYAQNYIAKYVDFEKKIYQKLGTQKLKRLIEIYSEFENAFSEALDNEISQHKGGEK